ncbi:hypothetical protein CICLE_v10013736mg, partial [Citrus x clementina]
ITKAKTKTPFHSQQQQRQQILKMAAAREVRGSFLDKSEVTDRVISVVKNFQKVDPSK